MAITAEEQALLNRYTFGVPAKIKLGDLIKNAETGGLGDASVDTDMLQDSAVTAAKLGALAVTTAKIDALAVTAAKLAADAVTTVKILDANVTLAKLAAGVAPSHVVKFAGTFTTAGGDANETITVTGAAATDIAIVQLHTKGGTPRTILTAQAATNAINMEFSGDPGADHVVRYMVLRAAV